MKVSSFSFLLFLFCSLLQAQDEEFTIIELPIVPEISYNSLRPEIVRDSTGAMNMEIRDYATEKVLASGKLSSSDPLIKEGRFTFFNQEGKPYAMGYYKNDLPFRVWSFFDAQGKVSKTIDYSATLDFINKRSNIDIGNDFVYWADVQPKSEYGTVLEYIFSLEEHAEYPPLSIMLGEEGRVICQVTISREGKMINPTIVRGATTDLNMEVMRLLSLPVKWSPAMIGGEPVNYVLTIPFHFGFEKNDRMRVISPLILNPYPESFELIEYKFIKVYFDQEGKLSNRKHFDFYRTGSINPQSGILEGEFTDFDQKGNKLFEGYVSKGTLNGEAKIYYRKGGLKEKGNFNNGIRDGTWTFYYPTGQVKAILQINEEVYVSDYFKWNGEERVINGYGIMKWVDEGIYKGISGMIRKGLRVRTWENSRIEEEYDENGNFIRNRDKRNGYIYSKEPFDFIRALGHENPSTVFLQVQRMK